MVGSSILYQYMALGLHMIVLKDIYWYDKAFLGCNTLQNAIYFHRFVVNVTIKTFKLSLWMDCFFMTNVCILVKNDDDRSSLSLDNIAWSDNRNISNLVIVYTLNIYWSTSFLNKLDICTAQSSVCTTIYKGTFIYNCTVMEIYHIQVGY